MLVEFCCYVAICSFHNEYLYIFQLLYIEIIQHVSEELKSPLRDKKISEICRTTPDGQMKCICFSVDVDPEMIDNFAVFGKECKNDLFDSMWSENCEKFYDSVAIKNISFCDIYEKVWKPTIASCQFLLHVLYEKTITVSNVHLLGKHKDIDKHLTSLCAAMHHCYPDTKLVFPDPKEWVLSVSKDINQLLGASTHLENLNLALNYCLTLKERLQLKGDFSDLKDLDEKVLVLFQYQLAITVLVPVFKQ